MRERIGKLSRGLANLQRSPDWQIAFAMTAVLRVIYSMIAAVAAVFLHPDIRLIQSNAFSESLPQPGGWHYALLGIWQRFDTLWYLRIAERGYDLPAAVVFYPLYPWLIRGLSGLVGPIGSALTISTSGAFFYFWGFLRLARGQSADVRGLRTVMLAASWPAGFFLFAGYTEALAIALIVWCVVWARNGYWTQASLCAAAAGLTRSAGVLAIVPLTILAWQAPRRARWPVALAPFGTIGYWWWLHDTGRISIATAYQTYWNTRVAPPWSTLGSAIWSLTHRFDPLVMISLIVLILFFFAGMTARGLRTEDRCFSAALLVHLLLRKCWPPLLGTPRYLLPMYPGFLTLGNWILRLERRRFIFLCCLLFAFNLAWMWAFLSFSLVL